MLEKHLQKSCRPYKREVVDIVNSLRPNSVVEVGCGLGEIVGRACARERFGFAILLDCHSMPSSSVDGGGCDIVLGDRFGSSAAGWVLDTLEQTLRDSGLAVRRNKPYAGGYITERHGAPTQGRHAVQIEINRALYMDERRIVKLEKAEDLAKALLNMARGLATRVAGLGRALAAE